MRAVSRLRPAAVVAVALAPLAVSALAWATPGDSTITDASGIETRVTLRPSIAKLGEPVLYRAQVMMRGQVDWLPPEPDSSFTWGPMRHGVQAPRTASRRVGRDARGPTATADFLAVDTSWVEIPLQVFRPGIVPIPGLRFRVLRDANRVGAGDALLRVPVVRLIVVGVITPADSAKGLRDVHGPLPAPWWERVPWPWVAGGVVLLALVVAMVWALRRRRPVPVAAVAPVRRDPMAEALAELRVLRALHLPEQGRFAEHAFRLGQILRRYLEATVSLARPGDTTPELVAHLRGGGLAADDLQRLTALLRLWDRVKFAREPLTVEEAVRTEGAVESYVRAREPAGAGVPGRVA